MGSCVSVNSESTTKLHQSRNKKNTVNSEQLDPQSSSTFRDLAVVEALCIGTRDGNLLRCRGPRRVPHGSKEEKFFDSQPWLDSDCEDFFSINGDFTPSHGNTPIHQSSSFRQTPQLDDSLSINRRPSSISKPSPTDNVKKLADLFRESFENQVDGYQNFQDIKTVTSDQKPEGNYKIAISGTPQVSEEISVCSNETTRGRVPKSEKQKLSRSVSCCLPSLARSMSFSERKKRLSPRNNFGR